MTDPLDTRGADNDQDTDLAFDVVELVACVTAIAPDTDTLGEGTDRAPRVATGAARIDTPREVAAALSEIPFRTDAWLPRDIADLRTWFAAGEDLTVIGEALGRTLQAVRTKLGELGQRRNSTRPFSDLEDAYLAQHYNQQPASTIVAALGRSAAAVYARARVLDLAEPVPPPYTAWEIAQVQAGYVRGIPVARIGQIIGRSTPSVASVANRLGVVHACALESWSAAERSDALAFAATGLRYGAVADRLAAGPHPRRTGRAVGQALRKLGHARGWGRPWSAEEDDLLRQAYARGDGLTPLQDRPRRTRGAIAARCRELGLSGTHAQPNGWRAEPPWTDKEIRQLRRDYGRVPTPKLAVQLGRKARAIYNKAFSLGLKHPSRRSFTKAEERAIRVAHDRGIAVRDLSRALDRDPATVGRHAASMGIAFANRSRQATRSPAGWPPVTLAALLAMADGTPAVTSPRAGRPR